MPDRAVLCAPFDRPIRLGVLISGGGTTLENLLVQIGKGRLHAEIALVAASRPCAGVQKARQGAIETAVLERKSFATAESFSEAIFARLRAARVDLVLLAGFLSRLVIPQDFTLRVMNIHPALIPAFCGEGFYGQAVHQAVLDRGCKVSGCTVHFADNEYDHGPIILQRCVSVECNDTPQTLAARVFAAECQAYPEAVSLYAQGRLAVEGPRVHILPPGDPRTPGG